MGDVVLALDQGTTSSRAMAFDGDGLPLVTASAELRQIYPRPGWVEHDPERIWRDQVQAARSVVARARDLGHSVAAIGIANQRETTLLWDRRTGEPVHNAIVWQDRRTAERCAVLRAAGWEPDVRRRTGLVIDPYFSATKVAWLLDNIAGLRGRADRGELAFGTVDSWLLWRLTGGRVHATDASNASRTMLFNIHTLEWDTEILAELRIPRSLLGEVLPSSHRFGVTASEIFGDAIRICGVAGDQQAATFGQACFTPGMAKQTYGTGSFLLLNTGERPVGSSSGLLTTVAWLVGGHATYALEGSSFVAGAGVQWLRDELGIIESAEESEALAGMVASTGVCFVPALAGLGAPWWDPTARGALLGLSRGTGRGEITRAVLEAVAFQTRALTDAMQADTNAGLQEIRVDGGMAPNDFLMQFQSDVIARSVVRPRVTETTALGAAYLAGLDAGIWHDLDDIARRWQADRVFRPTRRHTELDADYHRWLRAVEWARNWSAGA
jgi:glycerol kinase